MEMRPHQTLRASRGLRRDSYLQPTWRPLQKVWGPACKADATADRELAFVAVAAALYAALSFCSGVYLQPIHLQPARV